MTTETEVLDINTANALATILGWAQRNARVTWAANGHELDRLITGTVRSVGDELGNFARNDDDVRDLYLRITATFEFFIPIRDVIFWLRNGVIYEER